MPDALLPGPGLVPGGGSPATVDRLDLTVDEVVPMGAVSVASEATRTVQLSVPGRALRWPGRACPRRGRLPSTPTSRTGDRSFATATEAELESGTVSRSVDTSCDCFVRAQIRDADDRIVAFSNPIWLLRKAPPGPCRPRRAWPGVTTCGTEPAADLRGYGRFRPAGPVRVLDTGSR